MSAPASTLQEEGELLIELAKSMGKSEAWLREGGWDDVSCWNGIGVSDGRVVRLDWYAEGLTGQIPPSIGR